MGAVGLLFVAGTGIQLASTLQQANAAQKQGKRNAAILESEAQNELYASAQEQERIATAREKDMGAARAAYGASGVTLSGTPMDVLAEQAATARKEIGFTALQGLQRATMLRRQAAASISEGKALAQSLRLGALSTLMTAPMKMQGLGGGGGVGSPLQTMSRPGQGAGYTPIGS